MSNTEPPPPPKKRKKSVNTGARYDKAVTASYDTMFSRDVTLGKRELAATGKEWKVWWGRLI